MTISEYINTKTIEALLDKRQDRCKGLLEASYIATGLRCPEGHGEAHISLDNNSEEAHCAVCDEYYSLNEATCDKLQELGYDVEVS